MPFQLKSRLFSPEKLTFELERHLWRDNWFLNQFVELARRSVIVCFLSGDWPLLTVCSLKSRVLSWKGTLSAYTKSVRIPSPQYKSLMEGHNWFLIEFVEFARRSIIVCLIIISLGKSWFKPFIICDLLFMTTGSGLAVFLPQSTRSGNVHFIEYIPSWG